MAYIENNKNNKIYKHINTQYIAIYILMEWIQAREKNL